MLPIAASRLMLAAAMKATPHDERHAAGWPALNIFRLHS
jgi:hypothetical protein